MVSRRLASEFDSTPSCVRLCYLLPVVKTKTLPGATKIQYTTSTHMELSAAHGEDDYGFDGGSVDRLLGQLEAQLVKLQQMPPEACSIGKIVKW